VLEEGQKNNQKRGKYLPMATEGQATAYEQLEFQQLQGA